MRELWTKNFVLAALFLSVMLGATAAQGGQSPIRTTELPAARSEEPGSKPPRTTPEAANEKAPDAPPSRESAKLPRTVRENPEVVSAREVRPGDRAEARREARSETRREEPRKENPRGGSRRRPNILFVLTDDQTASSISKMPKLKSLVTEKGARFDNFFVTTPRCCPSRATFLRGQYPHNSRVKGNALPLGGFQKFKRLGKDRSTVATWLDDAGYTTFYLGKYLNNYDNTTYVPPGWDRWFGWQGHYYSPKKYRLNENGRIVTYDRDRRHDTDLLANKAVRFVENQASKDAPFFMYVAPNAPHKPAYVAERHRGMFSDLPLPNKPSLGERNVSDKPAVVRNKPPLSSAKKAYLESLRQRQLASLQSVDDMVGDLVQALRKTGQLENTYVMFSSDNGFFYGEHRLEDKSLAYEEAARVPFVVRGPGVAPGRLDHLVINNDFAPTIADLAGVEPSGFVDGKSFASLLQGSAQDVRGWRKRFLIELWVPDYKAMRTTKYKYVEHSTGEKELYNLHKDPHELRSRHETANPALLKKLGKDLDRLRDCKAAQCRAAEQR